MEGCLELEACLGLEACLAQIFHPFSASAESDGARKACLAQTVHPISISAESDGARKACLAQTICADQAFQIPSDLTKSQNRWMICSQVQICV